MNENSPTELVNWFGRTKAEEKKLHQELIEKGSLWPDLSDTLNYCWTLEELFIARL